MSTDSIVERVLTTMNSAVAAVTLGPIVHKNVYGKSRLTGEVNGRRDLGIVAMLGAWYTGDLQ
jgi:hypothetical protein